MLKIITTKTSVIETPDAMMVSCQVSVLQLVSHHVIENSGDRFNQGVVGLHQILAGNVITCLEPLLIVNAVSSFEKIFFLGLGLRNCN